MRLTSLTTRNTTAGFFAAFLILHSGNSALAIDAEALAKRFAEFVSTSEGKLTYQSTEINGDGSISIEDATFDIPDRKPIKIASINFDGITENANGSLTIDAVSYNQLGNSDEFTFAKIVVQNHYLPSMVDPDPMRSVMYFSSAEATNMRMVSDGHEFARVASMRVNYGDISTDKPIDMEGDVNGIALDLTSVGDPQFQAILGQLGYDGKFSGSMMMKGSWNPADGRMLLSQNDISIDNVGTLGLTLTINGLTPELTKRLQQAEAIEKDDPQAMEQAMMAEMENVLLESAMVKFTDASITSRALKFQASQMGGSPDDVAKMAPMMLPMVMAGFGNPEFTTMVAGAVGRFLGEPGNIAITAAPATPLPFSEIIGISMAAPQTLPDALAVKVTANE